MNKNAALMISLGVTYCLLGTGCLQNNSHPFRSWFGAEGCQPTLLTREIKLLDSSGKLPKNFRLWIWPDHGKRIIPTPYFSEFKRMEVELTGTYGYYLESEDGCIKYDKDSDPKFVTVREDGVVHISYPTYFPKELEVFITAKETINGEERTFTDFFTIKDLPCGKEAPKVIVAEY